MTNLLQLDKQGQTAIITLNNPPANTWTKESLDGLYDLIQQLNDDPEVVALVIKSDSEKFFSAGADLKLFSDGDKANAKVMAEAFGRAFEALSQFRGVSIAAINGWAMGGGLEVALACDLRIAEEQVQMALPECSVGLLPCAGGTQNLTMLVGEGWAKRMILCGERVTAAKAEQIGLVEEVVPTGQSAERALALAAQVAKQSPTSVRASKRLIQNHRDEDWLDGNEKERELFLDLFDDANQREGVNAFLKKRAPEWQ